MVGGRPTKEQVAQQAALDKMFEAYEELRRLGWQDAIYCPKDGTHFQTVQLGSTGVHDCAYHGEWPDGHYMTFCCHDCYPSSNLVGLFRLYPKGQTDGE
jgi:hypothetical protein